MLENPQHVVLGKEPVLHQGNAVGYVTSAYFGHTIGKQLAYAWVPAELSAQGTGLSIRYFDRDYPGTVGQDPQFDPQMTRLRSYEFTMRRRVGNCGWYDGQVFVQFRDEKRSQEF